jgi:hypothetical protein
MRFFSVTDWEVNLAASQGWVLLFGSGLVAFLVNYSGCLVIGLCSPITHQILGRLVFEVRVQLILPYQLLC